MVGGGLKEWRGGRREHGMTSDAHIHPTAEVSPHTEIGAGTRIWHHAQVREGARLGSDCIVGKGAYIDFEVEIGNHVKIQNYALVYHGATVEDGVFIGPHACLTNDKGPRAVTPSGALKRADDWQVGCIVVRCGASVGAGAIVLPGVTIGRFAMVGAGAVVTDNVPDFGLVLGQPARLIGYVCRCGQRLVRAADGAFWCSTCKERYDLTGGETCTRKTQRACEQR
jgi:UDP-2-acetamido-3-amino-2,3-dideoxy-glucuronate N-acetyltransferase